MGLDQLLKCLGFRTLFHFSFTDYSPFKSTNLTFSKLFLRWTDINESEFQNNMEMI